MQRSNGTYQIAGLRFRVVVLRSSTQ